MVFWFKPESDERFTFQRSSSASKLTGQIAGSSHTQNRIKYSCVSVYNYKDFVASMEYIVHMASKLTSNTEAFSLHMLKGKLAGAVSSAILLEIVSGST